MAKNSSRGKINFDIKGIIFITIGVLMFISIFFPNKEGLIGHLIKSIFVFLFGIGLYIFPIILIFIGVCYIIYKENLHLSKKFYGIIIIIINTMLLIHMIRLQDFYNGNFFDGIKKLYYSDSTIHGGIISYLIDLPLSKLLGNIGCYVIFFSIYIISLILIFEFSIKDIFKKVKFKKVDNKPEVATDMVKETNLNKDKFIKGINNKIKIVDFMKNSTIEENNGEENNINEEVKKEIEVNSKIENIQYEFPSLELLNSNVNNRLNKDDKRELINNANKLEETLASFGVEAKVIQVTKGPSVTRFELQPSSGVKVSKIVNLSDDIALSLASSGVRIEAPIPGKAAVGIEVPNKDLNAVFLREVVESIEFTNSKKNLAFCLGKDIGGNCVVSDLTKMPHLLIAGATGSGKSVCINTLIISLLYKYSPDDVKMLLIDPKVVELSIYNGIPHLLIPVVTDPKKAAGALNWAVNEMNRRYKLFADNNVRNIGSYNELYEKGSSLEKLPLIVLIIDELADLMMACANDVEDYIGRLAQMARAAGMHLVIATQRPSVDVITGVIKANIPSRISFAVSSQIDSRTILDMAGAEKLLGKGDMLFYPLGESKPLRIQGAFISEEEVEKVVNFIKIQKNDNGYKEEIIQQINNENSSESNSDMGDELLEEAINIVIDSGQASTSLLQRRLRIGYNRAARMIDLMEERGIVSERDGSKPRQILIKRNEIG